MQRQRQQVASQSTEVEHVPTIEQTKALLARKEGLAPDSKQLRFRGAKKEEEDVNILLPLPKKKRKVEPAEIEEPVVKKPKPKSKSSKSKSKNQTKTSSSRVPSVFLTDPLLSQEKLPVPDDTVFQAWIGVKTEPELVPVVKAEPIVKHEPELTISTPLSMVVTKAIERHRHEPETPRSQLVPAHIARDEALANLQEPDVDPHQLLPNRGTNSISELEYMALMKARLDQLESGVHSVLPLEEAKRLADPIRIAQRELKLGLIHGLIQTDHRLPKAVQTWPLSILCQPDTLFPNEPSVWQNPGMDRFAVL